MGSIKRRAKVHLKFAKSLLVMIYLLLAHNSPDIILFQFFVDRASVMVTLASVCPRMMRSLMPMFMESVIVSMELLVSIARRYYFFCKIHDLIKLSSALISTMINLGCQHEPIKPSNVNVSSKNKRLTPPEVHDH